MTTLVIPMQALVAATERPAVLKAAQLVTSSLASVSADRWTFDGKFIASPADAEPSVILIASLLPEAHVAEPWPMAQARLRRQFQELCRGRRAVVILCTVFRHAPAAPALLARIRRLNLLAAELSHELRIIVADIDRDLADAGARPLRTDYRLQGPYAAAAAGKAIALGLLFAGLDAYVPMETQEAARALLRRHQPPILPPRDAGMVKAGAHIVQHRTGPRRLNHAQGGIR